MKKVFLTLSFVLMNGLVSLAQVNVDNIYNQYSLYEKNNVEGNVEESLNYVNPLIFQFIPQETFTSIISSLNVEGLSKELLGVKITDVRDSVIEDGVEYVIFSTNSAQKMIFSPTYFSPTQIQEIVNGLQQNVGEGVTYEQSTNTVTVVVKQKILASSSDGQHSWKFIDISNDAVLSMLKTVLPETIFR